MKAIWNGQTIAESVNTVIVEGNHYFPGDSVKGEFFSRSGKQSTCPWKGEVLNYDLEVAGRRNDGAAWFYLKAQAGCRRDRGRVAFWRGVDLVE